MDSINVHIFIDTQHLYNKYDYLCPLGVKMMTKKRMMVMFQFGATIGPSRIFLFHNKLTKKWHVS